MFAVAFAGPRGERMEGERPLASWKEISAYLQCSPRTCQRWEKELDLPIHRLDGTPKARVFAYRTELDAWLAGKLNHSDVLKERRAGVRSRTGRWLVACLSVLAVLAAALIASRMLFPPWLAPPEKIPSLTVLPFENVTGDKSLDGWKTAFPDLVVTDLAQSRFVNVVRITDLYRALVAIGLGEADRFTDDDLRKIAKRIDVEHFATGAIRREGRDLVVEVTVSRPGPGEAPPLFRLTLHGEPGVFDAADRASRQIRSALLPDRKYLDRDVDRDVRKIATSSAEAFRLFSQGYRLGGINKFQESIALLQKAVELDPEFALAYKYLWRACIVAGREDDRKAYIRKAVELSGRLSEREKGDLLVLFYRDYEKDPDRERAALERMWRYHPDARYGGIQLVSYYVGREEWAKALPVARQGVEANKKELIFYDGLATCQANLGRSGEAEKTISAFIESNPDHTLGYEALRLRADFRRLQGDFDGALADLEALTRRFFPNRWAHDPVKKKSIIHILRGDYRSAEEELAKLLARENPADKVEALMLTRDMRLLQGRIGEAKQALRQGLEVSGWTEANESLRIGPQRAMHCELAYLHRLTGDLDEALREAEAVLKVDAGGPASSSPFLDGLTLKAVVLLDMGRTDGFERAVREIQDAVARQGQPKNMRICLYLLGLGELRKNNARKAIDHLWKAIDLLSIPGRWLEGVNPGYFFALAEAYMGLGRSGITRALGMYEKVIQPTMNRLQFGDLYARSFYRMAKIHDRRQSEERLAPDEIRSARSQAAENYKKFLEIWKCADPTFRAEIDDARRRLAALGSD